MQTSINYAAVALTPGQKESTRVMLMEEKIDFMLIDLAPLTRPTPTIAPTMVEEVDTGIPISENRCIPKAEAIYAVNAPGISSGVIPLPTVSATFLP